MRILMINLPYAGHVMPTIGLVQALVRLGCRVTYLMPQDWEERLALTGADFAGYAPSRSLGQQMKNAREAAQRLIPEHDLVLYEQFFFIGKHLAEKYGKPAVRIFTAPATNERLMRAFTRTGPMAVFRWRWLAKAFTRDAAGDLPVKEETWLEEIVRHPPGLNLVYALKEFQMDAQDFSPEKYLFLGPSVYERPVWEWGYVKGSRPLVYISLGTVVKGSKRFYRLCVEAFRDAAVDVIISAGDFDPRRLGDVPLNIRFYPSVPQPQVLAMADVFVTHGGMNSVNEALVAGVPMAVIPLASDQPENARQVTRLGAGQMLAYRALTAQMLRETALSLMKNEQIRANLRQIQGLIHCALGNEGGAKAIIAYGERCAQSIGDMVAENV